MDISVKQIYFREDQLPLLSEKCIPIFNQSSGEDHFLEYKVILESYQQDFPKTATYTGVISWRFENKTRIAPSVFLEFCRNNPGYDVYFINPFFEIPILYKNVWDQGEKFHPNLRKFAQFIFNELSYDIDIDEIVHDEKNILYSNYWIGNTLFWEKYINYTRPIYDFIVKNAEIPLIKNLKLVAPHYHKVSYIPFIMERLFSTFLWKDATIRSNPYIFSPREKASVIEELRLTEARYGALRRDFALCEQERADLGLKNSELSQKCHELGSYQDRFTQLRSSKIVNTLIRLGILHD